VATAAPLAGTVGEALAASVDALAAAGVQSPRLDAELLLVAATGRERAQLAAEPEATVDPPSGRAFGATVRRRIGREPVAYILGRRGFRRLDLAVDRRALIPRPETELLVELALELRPRAVLDVGTGSGAVALALADELGEDVDVVATDVSKPALALAAENARRLGLADRVRLVPGTLPDPPSGAAELDLVVANLPYVREDEWEGLAPEITRHEPRDALVAGPGGLEAIEALVGLVRAPALALEVGAGQADAVRSLLDAAGYPIVEAHRDLAGIERVAIGRGRDAAAPARAG